MKGKAVSNPSRSSSCSVTNSSSPFVFAVSKRQAFTFAAPFQLTYAFPFFTLMAGTVFYGLLKTRYDFTRPKSMSSKARCGAKCAAQRTLPDAVCSM